VFLTAAGANITCILVVTNTGTDWLHDITVVGQDCAAFLLGPGKSITCQTYQLTTQANYDNFDAYGELFEASVSAQAHSLSNSSQVVCAQDAVHVELLLQPAVMLFLQASPGMVATAGELLCMYAHIGTPAG
jgi:hypothetical protein